MDITRLSDDDLSTLESFAVRLTREATACRLAGLDVRCETIERDLAKVRARQRAEHAARRAADAEARRDEARRREAQVRVEKNGAVAVAAARSWLAGRLAAGPARKADVEREAEAAGHDLNAIRQVEAELKVEEKAGAFFFGTLSREARITYLTL
jgi:hypothetical protein